MKAVCIAAAVFCVALLVLLYAPKKAEATYQPPKVKICHNGQTIEVSVHAARGHRHHEGDYPGECKPVEEPKDYCDTLEGVQSEDADCPTPEEPTCEETETCEPETPPVPPVVDTDDDENGEACKAPSKVQGFRFQFVGADNRLRWTPKDDVSKVDIAVYGSDKTTLLYTIRTKDDGEHVVPGHTTWHRIRAVGNCGLSKWSALIN